MTRQQSRKRAAAMAGETGKASPVWRVTMWRWDAENTYSYVSAPDWQTALARAQAEWDAQPRWSQRGACACVLVADIPDEQKTAEDVDALDQSVDEPTMDASAYAPEM